MDERQATKLGRAAGPEQGQVDEVDEQILWELIRDGRVTLTALAGLLGVSPSTVSARALALKRTGVLKSVHAEIDFRKVGLPVQAMVFVRLRAQARPHVREYAQLMTRLPGVLNLYFIGGNEDFLIHLVSTSTDQLRDIVATQVSMHPIVASTRTHIVYEHALGSDHMHHLSGFDEVRRPIDPDSETPGVFDE
ncbi:Lrp/AsnC family transcriptional regulator [Microbacterium paraoxydans]|jgi:DNA-binding Lrp family transcriptional regulator|uniref:Lrp/AsnC family transcriptional regulator n=1 Tax=Microbacterium paraoxydans TaxID=199592 RepID=UPI00352C2DF0